ncbi:MAG: hypothetical protein KME32_24340 [Mojavia pulchra JT2-VF2]|uniref:Uncharacterized protein n=1 Tax=Mojavia pulchra JT2-VF2 TaxID=287848 RepID=A0A951UI55_9NOST|nr:hypothetical protein [Mojavia pulchra JT2-VF2]
MIDCFSQGILRKVEPVACTEKSQAGVGSMLAPTRRHLFTPGEATLRSASETLAPDE